MAEIGEMAKNQFVRFSDAATTDQLVRLVETGRWRDPEFGVLCAWLLRQSHQDYAAQISQSLLSEHGWQGEGQRLTEEQQGYLKLSVADSTYLRGNVDLSRALVDESTKHFEAVGCARGLSDALFIKASLAGEREGGGARIAVMEESVARALEAGDLERVNTSSLALSLFHLFNGNAGSEEEVAHVQRLSREGTCGERGLAHCFLMTHELGLGREVIAAEHGLQAQANSMEAGFWSRAVVDGSNLGVILSNLDDLDGALAQCQPLLDLARKMNWPRCVSSVARVVAVILSKLGRHDGALMMAKEAVAASSLVVNWRTHLNSVFAAAECALAVGDFERAEAWYGQARSDAVGAEGAQLRGYAALGLGKVLFRTGKPWEAVSMAKEALDWAVRASETPCRVECLRVLAAIAMGEGEGATGGRTAVDLLEEAVVVARQSSESAVRYALLSELAGALELEHRYEEAVGVLKDSIKRLEATRAGEAERRGAALEIRYRTEMALAEAEASRKAAEVQAAKSVELESLNSQLRVAMTELETTQVLLLSRNEELTGAYARISELSIRDPLTGLHNRRFLEESIQAAVGEARRAYRPSVFGDLEPAQRPHARDLLFFMLDMDHFKMVNDQYGHAAGDEVLVQLKDRLRSVTREIDFLVRWGGEEFLIAFRGVCREEGRVLADRLLLAVSCSPFKLANGVELRKTVSIGYAAFPQDVHRPHQGSWQACVELADARLYAAKRAGRNKAVGEQGVPGDASGGEVSEDRGLGATA
jgi:diguanylate cyclase (GGDEF)-like protein